ncbi:MAG: phosphate ABC transporter permease subunit PstC [Bacteroidetes bacterium]|nr:phosphate ABC transporter permease subunit PstC [Bacteroidota bacterium]
MKRVLMICAIITVLTTVGIVYVLFSESFSFFQQVSLWDFLTDTKWSPISTEKHFGILPLLSGTLLTTFIAMIFAVPMGITIAIYLSEYAPKKFRYYIKPLLEILAAIPTVVYGFFALTVVTPFLQGYIPGLAGFNALSAGLVMGIMIIPMISSLSEDALYAVPKSLREGAYGMGSTRLQTSFNVILPAASSGIIVSVILAFARAVGETMIVTVAAGNMANLTADPRETVATITAFIVNMSTGDVPQNSIEYQTIFAAGVTLFVFTFLLNSISFYIKKRFQEKYD